MQGENRAQMVSLLCLALGPLTSLLSLLANMYSGENVAQALQQAFKFLLFFTLLAIFLNWIMPSNNRKIRRKNNYSEKRNEVKGAKELQEGLEENFEALQGTGQKD